jgi:hypothetical protein
MIAKKIIGILLLTGAFLCLLVGRSLYSVGLDAPASIFGIPMMIAGVVLGLLGLAFLFAGSVTTVMQNIESLACVIVGACVLWSAASGLVQDMFKGRDVPTSVLDKPAPSRAQLVLYGGVGVVLILYFGRRLVRSDHEKDTEDDTPRVAARRGGVGPRDSSRSIRK